MPERYRKFAKECLEWSKQARTELERRDFLEMAEASMRAAAEYGGVPSWVGQPAASPEDNRPGITIRLAPPVPQGVAKRNLIAVAASMVDRAGVFQNRRDECFLSDRRFLLWEAHIQLG